MPWAADVTEDESPASDKSCRAVHSLVLLLVPDAGHTHCVEEHVPIKLNLGKIFSWHIDTSRYLLAHPCHVEEEAGQAEEVVNVQGVGVFFSLPLQPVEHFLSLQAELWEDVDRGHLTTRSLSNKGGDSIKDG